MIINSYVVYRGILLTKWQYLWADEFPTICHFNSDQGQQLVELKQLSAIIKAEQKNKNQLLNAQL